MRKVLYLLTVFMAVVFVSPASYSKDTIDQQDIEEAKRVCKEFGGLAKIQPSDSIDAIFIQKK